MSALSPYCAFQKSIWLINDYNVRASMRDSMAKFNTSSAVSVMVISIKKPHVGRLSYQEKLDNWLKYLF